MIRVAKDYIPIGDYAIIGDCRGAGLVSKSGSLDWLCFSRYDSPSVFAAILDADLGGRFSIQPAGLFESHRRYIPDTNILETTFRTSSGRFILRDLMPVASEEEKQSMLVPQSEVLREMEGIEGEVEVKVLYEPRPGYGRINLDLRRRGELGLWCEWGASALILCSELPLDLAADGKSAHCVARIRAGERSHLSLVHSTEGPAVIPCLGEAARARVERSVRWWTSWAERCMYEGPYRDAVMRSALTLKLMAYAPSGAVVAAPTTSLPERIGGERNWDYRYCWLRDASFTLRALFDLGYDDEGEAFLSWILHATRLTWPELQVLYDVYGAAKLPETELSHLAGYVASRPVRTGNNAQDQLQLDVYGEVIDAAVVFAGRNGRFDRDTSRMLNGLGHTVCRRWREPDEGIWEGRSGRMHHTHSKVLCWVALDRLVKLHESGHIEVSVDLFRNAREQIRREIEVRGYNEEIRSYTRLLDGDDVDASLLLLPLYGYVDAGHPRMVSTCRRIGAELGVNGLLYRYKPGTGDGLSAGEGTFGICSYWEVECMARRGAWEQAAERFEQVLGYANDVGLFSEEIDPSTGASLGNFPQAFTHVGLINAALTLAGAR